MKNEGTIRKLLVVLVATGALAAAWCAAPASAAQQGCSTSGLVPPLTPLSCTTPTMQCLDTNGCWFGGGVYSAATLGSVTGRFVGASTYAPGGFISQNCGPVSGSCTSYTGATHVPYGHVYWATCTRPGGDLAVLAQVACLAILNNA
jgi:hypothetical protein